VELTALYATLSRPALELSPLFDGYMRLFLQVQISEVE
jgi:hypothetical protein